MLINSFQFIPGIGPILEKNIWKDGIFTWEELLNSYKIPLNNSQISFLHRAIEALFSRDISFFTKHFPKQDYWRLYKEFHDDVLFLDIETTGLSQYYNEITLIGAFDGTSPTFFVKDNNIGDFPDYVKKFKVIVTFNGTLFDLPFIKKKFPNIEFPSAHIDLRFLLRSIGISGPLKDIERQVNLSRPDDLSNVGGREAIILWNKYLKGDTKAFEKLLLYNAYDTMNLKILLNLCYQKKIQTVSKDMDSTSYQLNLWNSTKKPDLELNTGEIIDHQISIQKNNTVG